MMGGLDSLQNTLGHQFKDLTLLQRALRHASLDVDADNEAYEFLGDRVLGLAISNALITHYPNEQEGHLARRLNQLVSGKTCAKIAKQWDLQSVLKTDSGIKKRDKLPDAILADGCEAVLGAVFLDAGFEVACAVVEAHWQELLQAQSDVPVDSKSALQEILAKQGHDLPHYETLEQSGPAHAPHFQVKVVSALGTAKGDGASRKTAEQAAAAALLQSMADKDIS